MKSVIKRNTPVKYESPIFCCSYVMIKVKVFVYGRRRRRQQRRGYDNSYPDFRHGELKIVRTLEASTADHWAFFEFKVIRHVFGFGIEYLENKDIGIFGHIIVIDFFKRYSYHTYFSPISTSLFRWCEPECIVRNGEWRIFVNYSVFSALFPLTLRVIFEEGILGTPVQKDAVPPIFISNYHR